MAFFIPSIQFFFGLPRALFCFGIHFNAILGTRLILNNTNCGKDIFKYQNAPIYSYTSSFGFHLFLIVVNVYILFHVYAAADNLNSSPVTRPSNVT